MDSSTRRLRSRFAYSTMVQELREAIAGNKLAMGDRVAGEVALSKDYGISVTSVRRGIEILVEEGLLTRRQGSGTYVSGKPAESPSVPPRPQQRRDTVAILPQVQSYTYHPFFSERLSGIRTGLGQLGWATWEPNTMQTTNGADLGTPSYGFNVESIAQLVGQHPEFAGMILRDWMVPPDSDWATQCPIVSMEVSDRFPFVAYNWREELMRGFLHLLRRGASRIWTVSVFSDEWIQQSAAAAARAAELPLPFLRIQRNTNNVRTLSSVVRHAYDASMAALGSKGEGYNAILVGSDFEAQGVIDALQELGKSVPEDYLLLTLTNRESRLQAPWPIDCLVADGFAQGQALASLMHQQIARPGLTRRQITLFGQLEVGS